MFRRATAQSRACELAGKATHNYFKSSLREPAQHERNKQDGARDSNSGPIAALGDQGGGHKHSKHANQIHLRSECVSDITQAQRKEGGKRPFLFLLPCSTAMNESSASMAWDVPIHIQTSTPASLSFASFHHSPAGACVCVSAGFVVLYCRFQARIWLFLSLRAHRTTATCCPSQPRRCPPRFHPWVFCAPS
jgi:hypothetical protein